MPKATWYPNRIKLRREFDEYAARRSEAVKAIEALVETALRDLRPRPSVKGRAKSFMSYFKKLVRLSQQFELSDSLPVINDMIGIRVVCPFIEDLDNAEKAITNAFEVKEIERKGSDYSFKEFGYESTHILINIPEELSSRYGKLGCDIIEIQVRTILQDAWAEVEHELVYKAEFTPFDEPMKRKLAAVNASLSLADIVFQEIREYQRQLNRELGKRRETFFKKIEEATDSKLLENSEISGNKTSTDKGLTIEAPPKSGESIDDLLLEALFAHNQGQFDKAVEIYTKILEGSANAFIQAVILKHRGMAHFAQSRYDEAINDFSKTLKLDEANYKAAYYRAVVHSVQGNYAEAIEDFSKALEINPYHHFALFRRAQAYYHLGDLPKALADCEDALLADPDSIPAKRFRELVIEKLGD